MQASSNTCGLGLDFKQSGPTFSLITITVPPALINAVYEQAVECQKKVAPTFGFHKRETPAAYIEQNYQSNLFEHIQEFLLRYLVLGFLHQKIYEKKIFVAGDPRLIDIKIEPDCPGIFTFEVSLFPAIPFQEWKYFPFKAPKRKNYKDLDRQVESFIADEIEAREKYSDNGIAVGDWINYHLSLLNQDCEPVLNGHVSNLWLRIGDEEPDRPFQELFLKKKAGQSFASANPVLQEFFNDSLNQNYNFAISVKEVIPYTFFCFDQFKHHFRIKSNKEMYQRLIEVFSYRNDLSQRRTTVEESLKLLFSKHRFEVPNYLILRQQKNVMDLVQQNPDYHVYRVQKDFKEVVRELAEKQTREEIFLDQMAFEENIQINQNDLKSYLNLTKRPRMREFFYFYPPMNKMRGQEFPILHEELTRQCRREKTVNHIIYHLNKK